MDSLSRNNPLHPKDQRQANKGEINIQKNPQMATYGHHAAT